MRTVRYGIHGPFGGADTAEALHSLSDYAAVSTGAPPRYSSSEVPSTGMRRGDSCAQAWATRSGSEVLHRRLS